MSATESRAFVIATLPTTGRNIVRVTVSEFRGTKRLDIRLWRPASREYRATATGINLPLTQLGLLRAALAKAEVGSSLSARSRRRAGQLPPFTPLVHQYFLTEQFAALSPRAAKLLIELWMQFRGANNGDLCASWTVMRKRGWTSKDQLAKALAELEAANWIVRTRQGSINRPTLYAVTFRGIDPCSGKLDVKPDPRPSHAWRVPDRAPTKSARRVRRALSPARRPGHDAPQPGPITASIH